MPVNHEFYWEVDRARTALWRLMNRLDASNGGVYFRILLASEKALEHLRLVHITRPDDLDRHIVSVVRALVLVWNFPDKDGCPILLVGAVKSLRLALEALQ